jgi:hypothetical protein
MKDKFKVPNAEQRKLALGSLHGLNHRTRKAI